MITQKDKMLMLVLKDPQLQASYGFDATDYECLSDALDSSNPVVATVAKIIKELNGSEDQADQKRVYTIIFNYLNNILLV